MSAKMNDEANEKCNKRVEQFTPNLSTLQMTGFLVPGKRLNSNCALIINVVLYPLAIVLIVLELLCNKFTLRTSVEFLYITSSTCISFGRRIYFWRHGKRLTTLLECFKDEPKFIRPHFEHHRQQTSPKSSRHTCSFNWTFCSLRSVLLAMSIVAASNSIFSQGVGTSSNQPVIAGRPVFYKMWFFTATEMCDWQYFLVLLFQCIMMTLNLLSMSSVDAFNNAVMLSQAERAKMLNSIAGMALAPCRKSERRISPDFKQFVNYFDHLENTLAAADKFSGPLMVSPSLSGIAILMIYGLEILKNFSIQPFYNVCNTLVQMYACHKAGQVFQDHCVKLNYTMTNLPLLTDEGMLPGDYKANLTTLATLMRTSRRLRGFTGHGLFKISLDFFTMILIGTTGYVFFVNLIIK